MEFSNDFEQSEWGKPQIVTQLLWPREVINQIRIGRMDASDWDGSSLGYYIEEEQHFGMLPWNVLPARKESTS